MTRRLFNQFLCLLVLAVSANATNYYVSPTGNDANSGLSVAQAWLSIENGESKGLILAGDTINVLPGLYNVIDKIDLKTKGSLASPVVYRGLGGIPVINGQHGNFEVVTISEDHILLNGFAIISSQKTGVRVSKDSCTVTNCRFQDLQTAGVLIEGSGCQVTRSVFVHCQADAISIKKGAVGSRVYGNTVFGSQTGIDIQVNEATARIINNIVDSCARGISGVAGNVAAHNLFWAVTAQEYSGGVVDSAGGKIADPVFVDAAGGDFHLGHVSPAIDAGMDVGYPFVGLAPDMGAYETNELDHLEIITIIDTMSADSTCQFLALAHDSADNPAAAGTLTWSHSFGSGSIDSTGLFSPVGVGTGTVSVTSSINGITATTGSMYVRSGVPVTVTISPDTLTIPAGSSQIFSVSGIDKNANPVTDFGSITWSSTGGIGIVDSTGLFSATTTGAGFISASSSLGRSDVSDTIRVIPGPLAAIDVLPPTNVVPTLQSYQYTALGYDASSNLIADYTDSVTWTTTDLIGNIISSGLYTAGLVGSYWVKAAHLGIRDSGSVSVTLGGGLDHIQIELLSGTAIGDLALTTDDDSTQVYARGYTAANALIGDVPVDWSFLGPQSIGTLTPNIGTTTVLSLWKPGSTRLVAEHASGRADSTGVLTISAGNPASITIAPNTATLTAGDTLRFSTVARDADHNLADPQPVPIWTVSNGIGTMGAEGLFTAQTAGTCHIIATSGGLVDTSGEVSVMAGTLVHIKVIPDSVRVGIGDTIQFVAIGLDSLGNATNPGTVSWKALGRVGTVDATGRYVATAPGVGAVSVSNQIAGIADTTSSLRVEELYFSTIPLGNQTIRPAGDETPVAEFRIDNYFGTSKTITAVNIRDISTGAGTADELAANMIEARIYVDCDGDSLLSGSDSLLAASSYSSTDMSLSIPSIEIPADSGLTFIVTATSALRARDGDTVDVALIPGVDIETADLTMVAGPPLSNSLGVTTIDGMVAAQIAVDSTGNHIIRVSDSLLPCMTIDLPPNGYRSDTLAAITIVNLGTADESDFDSLVVLADNGDNLWGGSVSELSLGRMAFNGESWSRGGLSLPLTDTSTKLFIAAKLSRYPSDGTTITLGIPADGIRVYSGNDGPVDQPVYSKDTLTIEGRQAVVANLLPVPARSCVPGQFSGPLLAVQLTNGYTQSIDIDSCRFTFTGTDPQGASATQLESQVDSVYLYLDRDGDANSISTSDSLVSVCRLQGERANFDVSGLGIAGSGGTRTIIVAVKLNLLTCKNGNTIGFSLADSAAVKFDRAARAAGNFPLLNPDSFTINGFPSAAVTVHAVSSGNLYAGQVNQPVLDFEIPRNGYATDRLTSIEIVNSGTLSEKEVLEHVRLWKDVTENGYSANDVLIGELKPTAYGWTLDDIKAALDSPLNRFVVTVSVSKEQFDGGTLRFDLPESGVLTASGMTGPDDGSIVNVSSFLIFPSNRVTAISIPAVSGPVSPGSAGLPLLTFALYNGYVGQQKTLTQVTLTNSSRSVSSQSFADHEIGLVSLYWDTNKNRILDKDQLIGTGLFTDGSLRFESFSASLPPESLAYFFVTADLPSDLIDGDSLSTSIERATDLSFSEFVNLNGDLPLSSGGHFVVDGSIRSQYGIHGPSGRSISPGDSNIVLFALAPAANGDQQDWLNALQVANLGTASGTDISELSLWHDVDSDNQLNSGDSIFGLFAYSAGTWSGVGLTIPVTSDPPHLLVVGRISASANPNATIHLAIPKLGCLYESGNDGPTDSSLVAPGIFTVSTSGLRVSIGLVQENYSVGQTIDLPLTITNLSGGPVDSVFGVLYGMSDSSLLRLDSSSTGPVYLPIAGSFTSHFYFTAISEGDVAWTLRAVSKAPLDSSILLSTPQVSIQRAISPIAPQLLSTSPTAVTKGQTNIFPMTLGCSHPDTGSAVASIKIEGLRLRVADGQGVAVPANTVFSRLVLATGYEILSVVASVPAQSDIAFTFGNPVMISPGSSQSLMLIVDIAPNASAADFRISIDSASWIPLVDANTGQTILNAPTVVYPLRTAPTRIDAPSQQIAVSAVSCALPTINFGQQDAPILKLRVRHGGQSGSSGVQLTRLSLEVIDSTGNGLPASELFSNISVWRQSYLIGEAFPTLQDSSDIDLPLSTPLNLNAQEIDSMIVAVTVRTTTSASGFSLRVSDSSKLTVRDLNTGSALLAVSDTALATGNTFPIQSTWSAFRIAAEPLSVCPGDSAPSTVVGGADSVQLISLSVTYPTTFQHSSVRLTSVNLSIEDGSGNLLDPRQLFDRIGVRLAGGIVQYNQDLIVTAGQVRIQLSDTGLRFNAGDSLQVNLVGDLRLEAPYSAFAAIIVGLDEFSAYDMSDPERDISANSPFTCANSFPFQTKTMSILLPAGRPVIARTPAPVRIASVGSQGIPIYEGALSYNSQSPSGQIEIRGLSARLSRNNSLDPVSSCVSRFHFEVDGVVVGTDSTLINDMLTIDIPSGVTLSRGESVPIRVTCDISPGAVPANIQMAFTDSTFLTVVDKSLYTPVYPILSGSSYAAVAGELSIVAMDLKTSFTNYPNPFNPAQGGVTTIGFNLSESALIDIDMFTITGELVCRITNQSRRPAGAHQSDTWSGLNSDGQTVMPGVYFCRITSTYDSGRVETFKRKIAVLR